MSPVDLPQCLAGASAYLALALFLQFAATRRGRIGWPGMLAASLACFGTAALLIEWRSDLAGSRGMLAIATALGTCLAVVPLLRPPRGSMDGLLTVAALGTAVLGHFNTRARVHSDTLVTHRTSRGALYMYNINYYHGLVRGPLRTSGGALVPHGDGYLLATGDGDFYWLRWKGESLTSSPLTLSVPTGRSSFVPTAGGPTTPPRLRVTDMAIDSVSRPARLVVGYVHWNQPQQCITLRVSSTTLDSLTPFGRASGGWTTLFESKPCLSITPHFDYSMTGGRLAFTPSGKLLFTTGDFDAQGVIAPGRAQTRDNDYGKLLLLDQNGGSEIFSMGLRNPEGLTVSLSGKIWETEHGPQGGDEINLMANGANYGWPLVTYGTEYGLDNWPLAPTAHDHGSFTEPAHVFVPSVGVSNVIELHGREFPRYDGDLLVASLVARKLLRAHVVGDRIIYVKETQVDRRIRDLAQGSDGRIALWTDEGDVVILAAAPWNRSGEELFGRCAHCHAPTTDGSPALGPPLRGIVGRDVASAPDFVYSDALRTLGGTWTRERLDSFLSDPGAMAPGTAMTPWGVHDEGERARIVEYLLKFK
ncbi:MAG: PQQ-dependent sugar dehydrogenase [Gemmatimonadota bacterium]|nr:PQQ-dependent sugar dehydrogenase [Gemmatimonadota bacterium]